MSTYTTNTSDRKKNNALKWWRNGLFGLLGLEYFYVGKMKAGIIRLIIALFIVGVIITVWADPTNRSAALPLTLAMAVVWASLSLFNLYRLKMGTFKDNTGAALRE